MVCLICIVGEKIVKMVRRDVKRALVLYHSQQYGNTEAMANAVAEGIKSAGVEVDPFNTAGGRFDAPTFGKYSCVAFGSPDYFSYVAGGIKTFMDDWYVAKGKGAPDMSGKPYALFFTHGGGGKAKEAMEGLFRSVGKQVGTTVECQGKPDQDTLKKCRELGAQLAASA